MYLAPTCNAHVAQGDHRVRVLIQRVHKNADAAPLTGSEARPNERPPPGPDHHDNEWRVAVPARLGTQVEQREVDGLLVVDVLDRVLLKHLIYIYIYI